METWQALVLGAVEGITEYLPVSSTGHLVLTSRLLGLPNDAANRAFSIGIQSGAILAVLTLYLPRVKQMFAGLFAGDVVGRRLLLLLVAAFVPAAVVGLALNDWIDEVLFGLWPIVIAWLLGGIAILLVRPLRRPQPTGTALEALTFGQAIAIGSAQCLALAPGTSRSLVTIAAAILMGLSGAAAVEFSLLLGVLTLGAATAHEAVSGGREVIASYGWTNVLVGFGGSFLFAWLAVKGLVAWLTTHGLVPFGVYRVLLAIGVAWALHAGWIAAG
ncbi:MAG: undecaprenyl-diphosphate phosphatase [Planctomycetota bacterium]|nr:undecaprenyl-diphosphate phosphatase [Planctomycetota bacterium]